MAQVSVELPVIAMAYDFLIWLSKHVAKFPRNHRHNVGDRIENHLYGILDQLLRAKFTRDRVPLLRQVNLELEIFRFQLRQAKDLKCISIDSYGYAAQTTNEIGQMVGGWLKATGGRGPAPTEERL